MTHFKRAAVAFAVLLVPGSTWGKLTAADKAFETKVHRYLESVDWEEEGGRGVPTKDPELQALYDLIIRDHAKRVLEIGTSTGKGAIWMAMAVRRTGGKLITIEYDEGRYKKALANFKRAGVSGLIDARLANAHDLVRELPGPFDLVFSDADKSWYKNYFEMLAPKIKDGGCIVTHDTGVHFLANYSQVVMKEYIAYLKARTDFETAFVDIPGGEGLAISYKIRKALLGPPRKDFTD